MTPAGRPIAGKEKKKRYQVMLEPKMAARLRKLGKGNLSRGIALAAALAIDPLRHFD